MSPLRQSRSLAVALWILSIGSIFLALKTSSEPVPIVFTNTWIETLFQKLPVGNTIVFDLSVGFLVSVIFYLLVVWFPDRRKKRLIKKNIEEQYRFFKEDTISILLFACQPSIQPGLPKKLSEQSEFRKFFNEAVNDTQKKWDVVLSRLSASLLKELLVELEILRDEVSFVIYG